MRVETGPKRAWSICLVCVAGALAMIAGAPAAWAQEGGDAQDAAPAEEPAEPPAETIKRLMAAEKIGEAAQVACRWADEDPGDVEALRACAELGRRAGRYHAAEDALRSLLFFEPNVPDTLVKLGEVLAEQGRYQAAREQFEEAIHLVDSYAPAFVGLAEVERYTSEVTADVLSAAEVALSVGPEVPEALAALGGAHVEAGNYGRALELLEQAIAAREGLARAWFDKGLAHIRRGETEAAQQAWQQYLQLEPMTGEAWRLRQGLVIADEREISDRVWYACFSPDGETIAYRARGRGGWGIYLRPAQAEGDEELLWATEANIQSIEWSPDGRRLLMRIYEKVEVEEGGGRKEQWTHRLYLVPTDGSAEAEVFYENRWLGEPCWIGDSGRVGVRGYVRQQGYVIISIDPETGEETVLPGTEKGLFYDTPRWSRDGARALLVRRSDMRPDGSYVYELLSGPGDDLGKGQVIYATEESIRMPRFSPDDSVILFSLALGGDSTRYPTWAMPADGSREPCLVDYKAGSTIGPEISPDDRFMLAGREYALHLLTLTGIEGG